MRTNLLSHIFSTPWAVDRQWADMVFPWVMATLLNEQSQPDQSIQRDKSEAIEAPDGLAYIFASGTVGKHLGMSEGGIDLRDLDNMLIAFASSDYKNCLLHIDSPGGGVYGVSQTAKLISSIQNQTGKKIIAYTDTMACSAAQWIIAPCASTIIDDHASIGSIGVYSAIMDATKALEKQGLSVELVTSGRFKGAGAFGLAMTDEQKQAHRAQVMKLADHFKAAMKQFRPEIIDDSMEGQALMGQDALDAGLADYISDSIFDAIEFARNA